MKNVRKLTFLFFLLMLSAWSMTSCENPNLDDGQEEEKVDGELTKLTFSVSRFEQLPFDVASAKSRASTDVRQVCSRISFAVFHNGNKVSSTNQDADNSDFGRFSVRLAKDSTYTVVVVAHNGTGSATISSPEQIKFKDNKMTDTFYYCQNITVGTQTNYELQLRRAVAMFRLVVNDNTPDEVTQMEFYYTGGSSTFDATTGYGCVKSKQSETRTVSQSAHTGSSTYEIYTLPRADSDGLKITVSAVDALGNVLQERVFENVPVKANQITQYSGNFYDGTPEVADSIVIVTVDDAWTQTTTTRY